MSAKDERRIAVALVVLAVLVRVAVYAVNRAFWGDEAMIALNIRSRDLLGLVTPLDFEQTMPIPVLLITKLFTMLLGHHEMVYRLPMFLAGCVLPFIIWRWYPALVGRTESLIILAFVAVWQPLVYSSSELKQYGIDATVTAVILAVTLRLFSPKPDEVAWRRLIAWGALAVLVSQPSVFVLAGVGASLLADRRARTEKAWRTHCLAAAVVWGATFAAVFAWSYRQTLYSRYMQRFWEGAFLTPGLGWHDRVRDAAWTLAGINDLPGMRTLVLLPLLAFGAFRVWRDRGSPALVLLAVPFIALVVASLLGFYPISARLILFAAPLLFWGIASAIAGFARAFPRTPAALAGALLFAVLWAPAAVRTARFAASPPLRETTRSMVRHIDEVDRDAPTLILFGWDPGWAYYRADWTDPDAIVARARPAFQCASDSPVPPGCDRLAIRDRPSLPPTLIGEAPPVEANEVADQSWADGTATRLLGLSAERAWVFYSLYPHGLAPRRLLERVLAQLEAAGARVAPPVVRGQSELYRVTLP